MEGYNFSPSQPPGTTATNTPEVADHIRTTPTHNPVKDGSTRSLTQRSCITCRRRKVKCDKTFPCANCTRNSVECVFPAPGRAPRKLKKTADGRDKELLERLHRLESVVKGMGVDVPVETDAQNSKFSGNHPPLQDFATFSRDDDSPRKGAGSIKDDVPLEQNFGRLVIDQGRSRYINTTFWANLSSEVEDLKSMLIHTSNEEDDNDVTRPPDSINTTLHSQHQQAWLFGYSSQNVDMLSLHPPPEQITVYWSIFVDRVDPLVKVLHVPTLEKQLVDPTAGLHSSSKAFEAVLFSIYYGVVTSLSSADCMAKFGEDRNVLLSRYRFGVEQGLARAHFLVSEEIMVLQAFVIFLICLRRNDDGRVIWTLTGLLVRMAQTIGIHRDGTHFNLPPLEIELRRRLWWQICLIDIRASEDHGCDPTIVEHTFDTKLPLNVCDSDLTENMTAPPPERQGCTVMTFCLIRFEAFETQRRIWYTGSSNANGRRQKMATLEDKEKWIEQHHQRLEERYLKDCDMTVPFYWVTATVARLILSKMWLTVYHPFQKEDGCNKLSPEVRDKLFLTCLENIEYVILLESEEKTAKWNWLFKTYMHWYIFAFMLSELCHRTKGDMIARAWTAVERARIGRWDSTNDDTRAGNLWRPLKKLYIKAREARQQGIREETSSNDAVAYAQPAAYPAKDIQDRPGVTAHYYSASHVAGSANGQGISHLNYNTIAEPLSSQSSVARPAAGPTIAHVSMDSNTPQYPNDYHLLYSNQSLQLQPDQLLTNSNLQHHTSGVPSQTNLSIPESTDISNIAPVGAYGHTNWQDWNQFDHLYGTNPMDTQDVTVDDWRSTGWNPSLATSRMNIGQGDWM